MNKMFGIAALTTLTVSAPLVAMDLEQKYGPDDFRIGAEVLSKHFDQGVVLVDDATAHINGSARYYGVGVKLDGWIAIGQDNSSQARAVNPGEITQFTARVDYLLEVADADNIPLVQILPYYEFVTYPNQTGSKFKDKQSWLGADAWYMLPIEGVELGGNLAFDPISGAHFVKSTLGSRQFFQSAPFDFAFHEVVNMGNGAYKSQLSGSGKSGFTTANIGAKVTTPLPFQQWWTFARMDWDYWMQKKDRTLLRLQGRDSGTFVIGFGVEYIAD